MANRVEGSCARDAFAVTASDTTIISFEALYIGGDGDVAVKTKSGTTVTFKGATAGSIIPISGTQVKSTNTTATDIVAMTY